MLRTEKSTQFRTRTAQYVLVRSECKPQYANAVGCAVVLVITLVVGINRCHFDVIVQLPTASLKTSNSKNYRLLNKAL